MAIRTLKIPLITGNNSDATDRPANGRIVAIYLDYLITPNANADVTIETINAPTKTLLTVSNNNTSAWYYPREIMQGNTAATVTYDGTNEIYEAHPVDDYIKATVAQGDADQTLDVWILLEQ